VPPSLAAWHALDSVDADEHPEVVVIVEGEGVAIAADLAALPSQSGLDGPGKLGREEPCVIATLASSDLQQPHALLHTGTLPRSLA
jgi:hypothetical protein